MTTIAKKAPSKSAKHSLKEDIIQKLETALESFKDTLGEKKFKSRIKKASKLFLKGKAKKTVTKKSVIIPKKKVVKRVAEVKA